MLSSLESQALNHAVTTLNSVRIYSIEHLLERKLREYGTFTDEQIKQISKCFDYNGILKDQNDLVSEATRWINAVLKQEK